MTQLRLLSICAIVVSLLLSSSGSAYQRYEQRDTPPKIVYDSLTGRFHVITTKSPTISVYWDKIVHDLVAKARTGPTIAAGAYVVMHSSIFEAWKNAEPGNEQCSVKYLSMHYAAYYALVQKFPQDEKVVSEALYTAISRCQYNPNRESARQIGLRVSNSIEAQYSTMIISGEQVENSQPMSDIEKWKPERVPIDNPDGPLQKALTPEWGQRFTFGVENGAVIEIPDPKRFLNANDATLDTDSGIVTYLNGTQVRFSEGMVNSDFIEQAKNVIDVSATMTAEQRFSAEAWEAGGGTSYPPGSWLVITQWVSARDDNSIDEDVGLFYAVSNALSDAGVATWYVKYYYNYARPVRLIRDLGKLGILNDVKFYDPEVSEVVTKPATQFITYQQPSGEPSPSFPEYTSGHSSFSSAAAEVLKRWTGSDDFGTGVVLKAKESRFERGRAPREDVELYWRTFSDAADDAGKSRLYGGIHFEDGNVEGLRLGRKVGEAAFEKAYKMWKY